MPPNDGIQVPAGLTSPDSPAPGAEDQKPVAPLGADSPAPAADDQKPEPEAVETPEQQAAKKESRRARQRERQIAERAALQTENRLLRERLAEQGKRDAPQGRVEPKREDYESLEAYYDARADYRAELKVDQRLEAERAQQQGREQQNRQAQGNAELAKSWTQREAEFRKATKDYEEVVTPFLDEGLQDLHHATRQAIVELGPEVLYHLATHEAEAERIAGLSPARQIAELGKLQLSAPKTVKASNAPPPAKPLGSGRAGASDPNSMSDAEYKAFRKSQGARWAQ